jgi:bud site selection protein 20
MGIETLMLDRVRALRDEPYSQKEAEAAVGLGTDNGKRTTALMEVDDDAAAAT